MTRRWPTDLILFDLDGTLIDSVADIAQAANHVLRELGRDPLPVDVIRQYVGDGSLELIHRCLGERGGDAAQATRRFRRYYREHPCDKTRLYAGVRECLASWPRLPMALVTNKPLENALPILEHLDLAHRFDPILGERSLPRQKPDPDPVEFVLRLKGVRPDRAVLVGDSPQDLLSGRAAGVRTVAALFGFHSEETLAPHRPDAMIHRFEQLADLLQVE